MARRGKGIILTVIILIFIIGLAGFITEKLIDGYSLEVLGTVIDLELAVGLMIAGAFLGLAYFVVLLILARRDRRI